jgi:23S rRNA pseudouridine955/2504/2580 synthase
LVELKVPAGAGRVARYLLKKFPNLHYSAVHKALREKDIKLNGKRLVDDISLLEGDILQVYLPDSVVYGRKTPDIAYEDQNLIVVNKGISVEVVGSGDTLQSQVSDYLGSSVFACHRLDARTGGLVVFAKNKMAYSEMLRAFRQREIEKRYLCIIKGRPSCTKGTLNSYLIKDSRRNTVKIFDKQVQGAVPISTNYQIISSKDDYSLAEVELTTGRTHQIRAHLAHIGHPLLGDDKYGNRSFNKKYNVHNQALWAVRIRFMLPKKSRLSYLNNHTITTANYTFPVAL